MHTLGDIGFPHTSNEMRLDPEAATDISGSPNRYCQDRTTPSNRENSEDPQGDIWDDAESLPQPNDSNPEGCLAGGLMQSDNTSHLSSTISNMELDPQYSTCTPAKRQRLEREDDDL